MENFDYAQIINEQLISGLSAMAFCRQRHLPYQTFIYHRKRLALRNQPTLPKPAAFLEIINTQDLSSNQSQKNALVHFGNASLSIPMSSTKQEWSNLLLALQSAPVC
jgi:hypothetical protein